MGKCTKCGTNFVGTPESAPPDGLCRYCERDTLRKTVLDLMTACSLLRVCVRDKAPQITKLPEWERLRAAMKAAEVVCPPTSPKLEPAPRRPASEYCPQCSMLTSQCDCWDAVNHIN